MYGASQYGTDQYGGHEPTFQPSTAYPAIEDTAWVPIPQPPYTAWIPNS
jgi:hypothetical protein